ncbi:MAG TPA: GNAT family N-acetyltransferase [Tepidisphaeraceae bacterium]|jgi:RimJ/RimL family protein N-acetyltransferase|nr:GNAT family N-acetyltransferase [Tepidisphaeraceae bacterium]
MILVETPRTYLRQWVPDDWIRLRILAQDPRVMKNIGNGDLWSDEKCRQFVDGGIAIEPTRGWLLWPVIYKVDSEFIGISGFNSAFPPDVEIGWWLRPEYWGKGIATEVATAVMHFGFDKWHFPRLISVTTPHNTPSLRIMQKLGMHPDRTFEFQGTPVISYAIPRPKQIP